MLNSSVPLQYVQCGSTYLVFMTKFCSPIIHPIPHTPSPHTPHPSPHIPTPLTPHPTPHTIPHHTQSLLNQKGLEEVQDMGNRIEQALSSGQYANATNLWGQLESLIEGVRVYIALHHMYTVLCYMYMYIVLY